MDSSYYTGNALTLAPITQFLKQIAGGNWGDEIYSVTSGARNPQIFERMTNWWHNQVLGTGDSSEDPSTPSDALSEESQTMTQAEEVSTGASKGGAYGGISQASSAAYLTTKRRGAAPKTLLTAGKSGARATVQRRTAV